MIEAVSGVTAAAERAFRVVAELRTAAVIIDPTLVHIYHTRTHTHTHTDTPVLFCSLAVLDSRVGHTMDALSPFIPVLCHSD